MMETMFKRFSAVLLCLLIGVSSLSAFQTSEWVRLSPLGSGFSIMMPGKPEEEVKPGDDFTYHLFTVSTSKAIYLAGYGDYAPRIRLDVAGELAANRDKFVKGVSATLTGSKDITLDSHPGLEFTAENDQASFKSRVYLFGNRVHQVAVASLKSRDDVENVNRFFASFAFTSSDAHPKP
jgi:hypothetical protein